MWAVLGGVAIVSLAIDGAGRSMFTGVFDTRDSELVPVFVCSAIAVVAGALVARRAGWMKLAVAAVAIASLLITVVGLGVTAQQNRLNSYPTGRPRERDLATRALLDPNGDLSLKWPFFAQLGALHPREVVLNDALWREWIDQVADVPFRIDGTYDPLLPLDDLRMSEEQLADIPLGDDQHMYIVGRGPVYRLYEWAGNYVFIAEVS